MASVADVTADTLLDHADPVVLEASAHGYMPLQARDNDRSDDDEDSASDSQGEDSRAPFAYQSMQAGSPAPSDDDGGSADDAVAQGHVEAESGDEFAQELDEMLDAAVCIII
jgi:hypothetical protein